MPKVSRERVIAAPRDRVWKLVSDPYSLPRWWPRARRVEDVHGEGERARWTAALETDRGATVRADFRCSGFTTGRRYAWSQDLKGTPFERILRSATLEVALDDSPGGTSVRITAEETLKGLSRLGSSMARSAAKKRVDDALDGIGDALGAGNRD